MMNYRFLSMAFIILTACKSTPQDNQIKIAGGDSISETSTDPISRTIYDTTAAVVRLDGSRVGKGSGTVIDSYVIITAAHVADGRSPVSWGIRDRSEKLPAGNVLAHEDFKVLNGGESSIHDLSLLILNTPLPPGKSIPLVTPAMMDSIQVGDDVIVAGLGGNSFSSHINGHLNSLPMKIERIDRNEQKVHLVSVREGSGACPGDSGGPVFIERHQQLYLLGINAHSSCQGGTLAAMSIPDYYDWIVSNLKVNGIQLSSDSSIDDKQKPEKPVNNGRYQCMTNGERYQSMGECRENCNYDASLCVIF